MYPGQTYEEICSFCTELRGEEAANLYFIMGLANSSDEYLLYEDDAFGIIPCIGAMTDEYFLVIPKTHVLSSGWLPERERQHLRSLLAALRRELEVNGKQVVFFEHGSLSFRNKGGNCYDHAHVHAVVTDLGAAAFINEIPAAVQFHETSDWIEDAHALLTRERVSYVSIEDGQSSHIGVAVDVPSQFFRQALARALRIPAEESDWIAYPQAGRVKGMLNRPINLRLSGSSARSTSLGVT